MLKAIVTLLALFPFITHADIECAPRAFGYNVIHSGSRAYLGNGFYQDKDTCKTAVQGAAKYAVCGAHNGGAAMFSTWEALFPALPFKVQILGNNIFKNLKNCNEVLSESYKWLVCAPHSLGITVVDAMDGAVYGNGYFAKSEDCINQLKLAKDHSYFCGAYNGGAILMDTKAQKIGAGYFLKLSDCIEAVKASDTEIICATELGALWAYSHSKKKFISGPYTTIKKCMEQKP